MKSTLAAVKRRGLFILGLGFQVDFDWKERFRDP